MPNSILTNKNAPGIVAKLAAKMLADNLQFCKLIDKADESDFGGKNGFSSGDTIYVSKPPRFIAGTNRDVTSAIQDVNDEKAALTLNVSSTVAIALTSNEIATDLALKNWADRILRQAVNTIAHNVESRFLTAAVNSVADYVGSPTVTAFDTDTMLAAGERLSNMLCPDDDMRYALLTPRAQRNAVNARKGLFQQSDEIGKQYVRGAMGRADGFEYYSNNLLPLLTAGTATVASNATTADLVSGTSTISVNGLTGSGTVTAGTVFTVAGVNAVHPITKADLGYLQPFVVTANATASSGVATLSVYPTPQGPLTGGLQNITTLATSGAVVTFLSNTAASQATRQNLMFHKSAFRMASVPLVMPGGVDMAAQETVDNITIRVIRDYEVLTDRLIMRLDFLGGIVPVRPEWAVRLPNTNN